FTASPLGLVAAQTASGTVGVNADVAIPITIAAGTTLARFSLFNADSTPGADLDLEIYNSAGTLVGASGGGTTDEEVNLVDPPAGNYVVHVLGFATPTGAPSPFKLYAWTVGSTSAGNMTVTPNPTTGTIGGTGTIGLTFNGLAPATRYLGTVVYGGAAAGAPATAVRIDTP
ncbi:MAG: hypothetical protein ABIX11_04010, partial [Casimicrobiaceae bacterium]